MYSKGTICEFYDLGYYPGLEKMGSRKMGMTGRDWCVEWYDARCGDYEDGGRGLEWTRV